MADMTSSSSCASTSILVINTIRYIYIYIYMLCGRYDSFFLTRFRKDNVQLARSDISQAIT